MEVDAELGSVAAAFRGTEEYVAAFDLEVWKAQQQARLRSEMDEERSRLQRELAAEVRKKEEARLGELDALRLELERMARRLQLREEALQRRIAQFEAREAVFEGHRVKVAGQHEQHLVSVETRARRQLEEAAVRQSVLQGQLREREGTIARLEEKLRAAESEYDTLQRYVARTVTEDEDKKRIQRLEEELSSANTGVITLQMKLKERDSELTLVQKERDQLQEAVKLCKGQLNQLTRRYSELQQQFHQRERMLLDNEHRKLEEAKRKYQLSVLQSGNEDKNVHRYDILGHHVAESILSKPVRDGVFAPSGGGGDISSVYLKELQAEVARGLHELRGKGKKKEKKLKKEVSNLSGPRLVYAEVPSRHGNERRTSSQMKDSERAGSREETIEPKRHQMHDAVMRTPIQDDTVNSTLSSLTQRECDEQRESTEPYHSPLEEIPRTGPTAGGREEEEGDGDVSSSYCYADVDSWTTDGEGRHVPQREPIETGGKQSSLPPLAPTVDAEAEPQHPPPPLPEDFMQAARAAPSTASRESTREEMFSFVKKLQMNKQRLLESGVYKENDTLVKEMTDKIALYEDFLLRHF